MPDPAITEGISPLAWIGGTIGSVITVLCGILGINKLAELRLKHRYERRDKKSDITDANQGKAIDQDVNAFNSMDRRLTSLEKDFKELQDKHSSLMATHAGLEKENQFLKQDNQRQEAQITDLVGRNRTLNDKVTALTEVVHGLQTRIAQLTGQPIDVRLVDSEAGHVEDEK